MSDTQEQQQEHQRQRQEKLYEYEQAFLGILLGTHPDELPALTIQPFCFSLPNNGRIFKAYLEQRKNGTKPDIMTLAADPSLTEIGQDYIAALTNRNIGNIQFYETEIIKAYKLRTAKAENERFKKKLEAESFSGDIDSAIQEHMKLMSGALYDDVKKDCFITFDDYINTLAKKEYWREYTPKLFGNLPFPDGTISAIGAAPGSGKSAALINLCRELLTTKPTHNPSPGEREKAQDIDAKRKMLFISAEMSTQDIADRLIHSLAWQEAGSGYPCHLEAVEHTNIDYWKIIKLKYGSPPEHWRYAPEEISRGSLYSQVIEEYIRPAWGDRLKIAYVRGRKCFDDIYNIILNNAEPGTLVLMDYLQLLPICNADIGQGNPRYLEIRHVMDMGIIAAEKTQSVIVAAAQLGREERRTGSQGDDTQGWRESGDIEQTAWNLIKLTRNDKDLSYRITKARNSAGVGSAASLQWIPGYQYMANGGPIKQTQKGKTQAVPDKKDKPKFGLSNA